MYSYEKSFCGITINANQCKISIDQFDALISVANERKVLKLNREMMEGERVNVSENRQALHTTLRALTGPRCLDKVLKNLNKICNFASDVRDGIFCGCRGDFITDIINIGIGGSEVGPKAVYSALKSSLHCQINVPFLSAVDGILFDRITNGLDPFKTLVIVSSKSFTTRETIVNALAIDEWFKAAGIVGEDRYKHFVVVSANSNAANIMQLPDDNYFPFWDWVGGRFSVWSSVGLSCAIGLGADVFLEFLAGAQAMDEHVLNAAENDNLALFLALINYYYCKKGVGAHCFLPYDERLRDLGDWLQQLEMESLGKHTTVSGKDLDGTTGMLTFGGHGNEAQHSFYQWLREGSFSALIDLCWCEKPGHRHEKLHKVLLANAKAQAIALASRDVSLGRDNFVTTLSIDELTPYRLGALMALYEHKTTMLGTLFDINPFDQPGVELGKKISRAMEKQISVEISK